MIPGGVNPMLLSGGGGIQISRSLRFRAGASPALTRTFATTGTSRQRGTLSVFLKIGELGTNRRIMDGYDGGSAASTLLYLNTSNQLVFDFGGPASTLLATNQVFRDPTAHIHVGLSYDTTQATPSDRVSMYVNGVQVTSFAVANYPALNATSQWCFNSANNAIGRGWNPGSGSPFDGYMSSVHFIDGQKLTPSAFGEIGASGNWQPKEYAGTYGINGFRLKFDDPTSLTTLCADSSGNGNDWTATNISLTAGATYDSMLDVPLGGGGNERGNYAVLSSLASNAAFSIQAGLRAVGSSGATASLYSRASIQIDAGKWYWEVTATDVGAGPNMRIGIQSAAYFGTSGTFNEANGSLVYQAEGQKQAEAIATAYGSAYTNGDVIGVALDKDAGTLTFYKNGVSQGVAYSSGLPSSVFPVLMLNVGGTLRTITGDFNFGQRPFAYAPPSGFKAVHTGNLTNTTPTTSGAFTGNVSADGPFVWCNGTPETLTINGNAVTWGTHADKTAGGFKLRTSSSSYNSSGTNTWTATYLSPSSKSAFKYQLAKGNP